MEKFPCRSLQCLMMTLVMLVPFVEAQEQMLPSGRAAAVSPALQLSRRPPPVYEQKLKALLTPLETVLQRRGDYKTTGNDGMILLDETVIHAHPDGRRVIVHHLIYEALNESGAGMIGEEIFGFRTLDQRIHLVEAATLPPQGRALAVGDGSIIMESPQSDSSESVYGDRGQMRIIFPAVKPGTLTRMVVVIEELENHMPGHFAAWESWGAFWPIRQARTVLHLPEEIESRLRETRHGAGVPERVTGGAAKNWVTWTYDKQRIGPDRPEHGRPPKNQTGPTVFLTTVPDWETLGDWYRSLLLERSELTEAMTARARGWARAADTAQEKAAAILGHVARDIRYTGLEFGLGALQPRAPAEVWASAFGDCKDKSNLAALLLRSQGIEAHLALIQTEHLGRVDRRSPDTRHFNHAIVAVKTARGWQFTDPTIRHATPGMLAPSSSDRDALIILPDGIEWARTPVSPGGLVHYHLDMERAEDGSVEGWLESRAGGYYLAAARSYDELMSLEERKRDVQQTLGSLLPGAQLIDLDTAVSTPETIWRAYFSQPSRASGDDGRAPASFPAGPPVLLSVGQDEKRETTRFLWPITWRVTGELRLPAGWIAAEVPPAFAMHTQVYDVEARWEPGQGLCRFFYEGRVLRSALPPATHPAVWRGSRSLDAWLQRPLWLAQGSAPTPAPSVGAPATLGKFPLMPSGEGQLTLVNRRYPENGNLDLRRSALRKVLEFFPDDPETLFTARVHLAAADWTQGKSKEAEAALSGLLSSPSPKVTPETLAWARYVRGIVLMELKRHQEAADIFAEIVGSESLGNFRRAWSCVQLSRARTELGEIEGALTAARAGLPLALEDSAPVLQSRVVMHLLELDRQSELATFVQDLADNEGTVVASSLAALSSLTLNLQQQGKRGQAERLLDLLEKMEWPVQDKEAVEALAKAREVLRGGAIHTALQKDLQSWFEARPDSVALTPPADGWPATREACAKAFESAENTSNSDAGHRLALRLLTAYEPDAGFPRMLWRAASHLEHHERQGQAAQPSELMRLLLELGLRLPRSDDHHWEMCFLQGTVLENLAHDAAAAAAHYAMMANDDDTPLAYQPTALERAAACHEKLQQWDKAAEAWSSLERLPQFGSCGDGLVRAAHLRLEQGHLEEALRLLTLVAKDRDFYHRHSVMKETLEAMLQYADNPALARAHLDLQPAWWADWQKLSEQLGIAESEIEPAIHDAAAFGAEITQAMEQKDASRAGELFRRLVHNARWVPAHAINAAWASLYRMEALHPRHRLDLKRFNLSLLASKRFLTEESLRSRSLYAVICAIDTHQGEAALRQIGEYFAAHPRDDHLISFAMSRLWALAAAEDPSARAACIVRLQQDLTSPALRQDRLQSIHQLIRLLRLDARASEIRPLLEAELAHSANSENREALAQLKQMLRAESESADIRKAIQLWLKQHAPPWFDIVAPHSLAEAGLDEEGVDIDEEAERLPPVPRLKLWLLAALEGEYEDEERIRWFANAFSLWPRLHALTREQFLDGVQTLLHDKQTPAALKDRVLRVAAVACADMEEREIFSHLATELDASALDEATRDLLEVVRLVFEADPASPGYSAAAIQAVQALLKKKDADLLDILVDWLGSRALLYGRLDCAQAVVSALAPARKPPGFETSELQSMRLGLVQKISAVKRLLPVHEKLADIVLAEPPHARLQGLSGTCDLVGGADYDALGAAGWLAVFLNDLKRGRLEREGLSDWRLFAQACSELDAAGTAALRLQLISALTAAPVEDDDTRASLVSLAEALTDLDSKSERTHLLQSLKPWRENRDTAAHSAIRLIETHIAVRTGQPLNMEALIRQTQDLESQTELRWLQLRGALAHEDAPLARKALDALGADILLDQHRLHIVIPALQLVDRKDELVLALELAEEAFQEAVSLAWTGRYSSAARQAAELAVHLNALDRLPPAWLDFCYSAYPERMDQLALQCALAQKREDWPAVLAAASELIEKYPTFYSYYWPQAQALWKLGRRDEARAPLSIYLDYCHDEPEHASARRLDKQLSSP